MPAVDGQEPQPAERPGGNEEERERIRDALVVQMNKGPKYMIFKKNQDEFSSKHILIKNCRALHTAFQREIHPCLRGGQDCPDCKYRLT